MHGRPQDACLEFTSRDDQGTESVDRRGTGSVVAIPARRVPAAGDPGIACHIEASHGFRSRCATRTLLREGRGGHGIPGGLFHASWTRFAESAFSSPEDSSRFLASARSSYYSRQGAQRFSAAAFASMIRERHVVTAATAALRRRLEKLSKTPPSSDKDLAHALLIINESLQDLANRVIARRKSRGQRQAKDRVSAPGRRRFRCPLRAAPGHLC